MAKVLSYGGGRQTVAICVLIARGVLPKPDRIVMADTGREKPSTWTYLAAHVQPLLARHGLKVEVVPPSSPDLDIYSNAGNLIIPVYTGTGKFSSFCSGTWKRDRVLQYLSSEGVEKGETWIGYAIDERRRHKKAAASKDRSGWRLRFPLVELMMTTANCISTVLAAGLPEPDVSACWMCPNQRNKEWRKLRDFFPDLFESACVMDEEIRAEDIAKGRDMVFLHHSKVPLRMANIDVDESQTVDRQCSLGMCFV